MAAIIYQVHMLSDNVRSRSLTTLILVAVRACLTLSAPIWNSASCPGHMTGADTSSYWLYEMQPHRIGRIGRLRGRGSMSLKAVTQHTHAI